MTVDSRAIKLRPCIASYYSENLVLVTFEGYFHQWGCNFEEFETGAGNYTMAIVEDEYGVCHECCTDVKFLDV